MFLFDVKVEKAYFDSRIGVFTEVCKRYQGSIFDVFINQQCN